MIRLGSAYRKRFVTELAGIATAADAKPTAILYRNGTPSGVSVEIAVSLTVAETAETGVYVATFTTLGTGDGWAKTDQLELLIVAEIDGETGYKAVVWDSDGDVDAPMLTADEAVKGLVIGSQPAGSLARFVRDIKQADVLFEGKIITATSNTATLNGDATSVCLGQAITIGEEGDIERQTRWVIGFDPATKVITLDEPWCVIPPDGADYQIIVLRRSLQQGEIDAIVDGAGGNGAIKVTITATLDGDGVPGVTFQIAGSVVSARTNTLGVAVLNVDPNETYTIRTIVPVGFEAVANQNVEVVADDVSVAVSLVSSVPLTPPADGMCNVSLFARKQIGGLPFEGVVIEARPITGLFAAGSSLWVTSSVTRTTDATGFALLELARGASYRLSFVAEDGNTFSVDVEVPDAESATIEQVIP